MPVRGTASLVRLGSAADGEFVGGRSMPGGLSGPVPDRGDGEAERGGPGTAGLVPVPPGVLDLVPQVAGPELVGGGGLVVGEPGGGGEGAGTGVGGVEPQRAPVALGNTIGHVQADDDFDRVVHPAGDVLQPNAGRAGAGVVHPGAVGERRGGAVALVAQLHERQRPRERPGGVPGAGDGQAQGPVVRAVVGPPGHHDDSAGSGLGEPRGRNAAHARGDVDAVEQGGRGARERSVTGA